MSPGAVRAMRSNTSSAESILSKTLSHTPYDGSSKPFAIGLKPLDLHDWIEPDHLLSEHLAEKRRLLAEIPEKVFVEEPGTEAAQREVLDILVAHLLDRHGDIYQLKREDRTGTAVIEIAGSDKAIPIGPDIESPLRTAALLVQEDLVLMRRDETGWRLVAASLSFPSSWVLTEKFGKPLHEIHRPVPAFGPGTRIASLIERIFDKLAVEMPVQRYNWTLQAGDALYHPLTNDERDERATTRPSRFAGDENFATAFMRVERQTLRKLPVSGDILFTIRIHLDPLGVLARQPDRALLAQGFAEQLAGLDEAQLDYKGLTADRDRLIAHLNALAAVETMAD